VVLGKGEYTMLEIARAVRNGTSLREVKGIATREFITPPRYIIEDLDILPFQQDIFYQFKSLNPSYVIFSLATPYPGTDFYMEASKQNLINVNDWSKYTL